MKTGSRTLSEWRAGVVALCLFTAPAGTRHDPLPETVLPCLPCHHREDRDQVAEWLASPYSEAKGGLGCTSCHGESCAATGIEAAQASAWRSRRREAVGLSVTADCPNNTVEAEVAISNVGVGHLLPTGSGGRSLMLELSVLDPNRTPLSVRSTPVDPPLEPFATAVRRYRLDTPTNEAARVSARLFVVRGGAPPREIARSATACRLPGEGP